jgi:O-antigen/teichoic acid export membrane protein
MLILGLALGAVQFIPYLEVVDTSFRGGEAAASLQDVLGWAYPKRRLITFGNPNFFGNPTHHSYFDVFTWQNVPLKTNALGDPLTFIEWDPAHLKNYVEGGAYLGLLPLFLATIAIADQFSNTASFQSPGKKYVDRLLNWFRHPYIPFFTLLAVFCLGCVFGTPLYAIIYSLPSFNQSHSPFRWVFPLTLCVAVLAGFGIEAIIKSRDKHLHAIGDKKRSPIINLFFLWTSPSSTSLFAALAFWGGLVTLLGLALSRIFFAQIEPLIERFFLSLAKAPEAFPGHRAFYSYEFMWTALFGLLLTTTGIVLRVSRCPIYVRQRPIWEILAVGILVLDMVIWGTGFAPATDTRLLEYTPPVVKFLKQDSSLWRYTTFTPPGTTKTMNANVGMYYDLQTIVGYDSLFTDQYRDYMALIEAQGETPYNRIASFRKESSLYSPLTDLLNVKYIITEVEIDSPKYELVYQDDAVRVYENLGAMPRAFSLPVSATVETDDFAAAVQVYDVRNFVILEKDTMPETQVSQSSSAAIPSPITQQVTDYTTNEVIISAEISAPSWLVLADSYFAGWKAFARPQGTDEASETQLAIHRVNGTFRGVILEPGNWTVRFKYSPDTVKVGGFTSFMAGMAIMFLIGLYLWRFFYREEDDASTIKRVAKNSIAPIILNLFIKAIDFGFGMLMARLLGPAGVGRYVWAANAYIWFAVIADFGLEMYVIREVSRDKSRTRAIFVNATILRLLLLLVIAPLVTLFIIGWQSVISPLDTGTAWTLILLCIGLLPFTLSNSLTALFRAYEKHEFPAAVQTATAIIKVLLGALALMGGLGIVGLAGTVILTNVATLTILAVLARQHIWADKPHQPTKLKWPLLRTMLADSWSVMMSMFLQSLFPTINVLLLKPFQGDEAVGWYDAGYKWLNTLQIIPQFFIPAIFPVMSRQAASQDRTELRQSYRLSIKMLMMLAMPAAIVLTLLAKFLVGFLSGAAFLPHGAIALQILTWSVIFGWINSLTNYVLIALNRQRQVMLASAARVVFTIVMNVLFTASYSYVASAWIIVGGELLLLIIFYIDLRRHIGPVSWIKLLWRTGLAALLMGGAVWAVSTIHPALALLAGGGIYPVALLLLRVLTPEEWAALTPLLPEPLRARVRLFVKAE